MFPNLCDMRSSATDERLAVNGLVAFDAAQAVLVLVQEVLEAAEVVAGRRLPQQVQHLVWVAGILPGAGDSVK